MKQPIITTPEELEALRDEIRGSINLYNEAREEIFAKGSLRHRLIMEDHVLSCRCRTCWYEFGGEKYAAENPNIEIYNAETDYFFKNIK